MTKTKLAAAEDRIRFLEDEIELREKNFLGVRQSEARARKELAEAQIEIGVLQRVIRMLYAH